MGYVLPKGISQWIKGSQKLRRKLEERIATHAGAIWTSLSEGIQVATANLKKIEAERAQKLTAIFDRWPTYPPDWEYRREAAKERDRYSCTKCGYPAGFKRHSGSALNWGMCYEKAGKLCGERGYEVLDKSGDTGAMVSANQFGLYGGSVINRSMIIRCKD
jgi:hypothetical protein